MVECLYHERAILLRRPFQMPAHGTPSGCSVKIVVEGTEIPYPDSVIRAKLRLGGLSGSQLESVMEKIRRKHAKGVGVVDEDTLTLELLELAEMTKRSANHDRLNLVMRYYEARRSSQGLPPVIVVLEGASATGKSMMTLELIEDLAATRILTTDTVRQALREVYSEKTHPELYCHTYQAHTKRQSGPTDLLPVVRGFIAQTELIQPKVVDSVARISREGTDAVVEGVHLIPGSMASLGSNVVEVVVDPPPAVHRAMFIAKSVMSGLTTVSTDLNVRSREFDDTRLIQDYLVNTAKALDIPVVPLVEYSDALSTIRGLVLGYMKRALETREHK